MMKKNFKYYIACWGILVIAFQVLCFATPNKVEGFSKFGGGFWSGYIFIMIAFVGQILCAYLAFKKSGTTRKMFYHLPLITVSYTGLILTLVFGGAAMAIPDLPNWVGMVICLLILVFTALSVIKANVAADLVERVDGKVERKTSFIKTLTVEAENLMSMAKSEAARKECKKVYEAVRYSDPMSSEELSVLEAKITIEMDEFSETVKMVDEEKVKEKAEEVMEILKERNSKCKVLK